MKRTVSSSVNFDATQDKSACGTGFTVSLKNVASQAIVQDGLKKLAGFGYRSGYNPVTEESDGAGIRFYGLPTAFFQKKLAEGAFGQDAKALALAEGQYIIGQYFVPPAQVEQTHALIEAQAKRNGLRVAGWRLLDEDVDRTAVSDNAWNKKPALWQAVMLPVEDVLTDIEKTALTTAADIANAASDAELPMRIVSQSSESIVYKGMIRPEDLQQFFARDVNDPDFTARAVQVHARMATNTNPQWANAQPGPFLIAHNGELNSRMANFREMELTIAQSNNAAIHPSLKLSDSIQFDADLANQLLLGYSLEEAFVRLMSLPDSPDHSPEIKAMLEYFRLERTPYNGPAFMVAGHKGAMIARLDTVGLRPSRWARTEDTFYAYSDELTEGQVEERGNLEPGGIVLITPEGHVLKTAEVLAQIQQQYAAKDINFTQMLQEKVQNLSALPAQAVTQEIEPDALQRKLFSAFWDAESVEDVVLHMARHGEERVGAMGDDTNLLPALAGGVLSKVGVPMHISYLFHQLFAQVSAPPLDSIKERDRFTLVTTLGTLASGGTLLRITSPILGAEDLGKIEAQQHMRIHVLDTSASITENVQPDAWLRQALKTLLENAEKAAEEGGVLIISDRNLSAKRALIPDMIAVAAVRKHLEQKGLMHKVSIVADSYQITGPHQAAALLAVGANAVYPRGAYEKIQTAGESSEKYQHAMEKTLLKIMGKMGITDIQNYTNGNLIAALGLNLADTGNVFENPSLGTIFSGIYSPVKGIHLGHIAHASLVRHEQAYTAKSLALLPHFGYFHPEHEGIKHGYGPEVINAFTTWMHAEDIAATKWRIHQHLKAQGISDFIPDEAAFTAQHGFLDASRKVKGFYPAEYLDGFKASEAFKRYTNAVQEYRRANPSSISDMFEVASDRQPVTEVQSAESIRAVLFSGSMSQGALTVSSPDSPSDLKAHETIMRGMNAIGAMSAAGEGGESPKDMTDRLTTARSKQVASGRFGVSVAQLCHADEVEIKVAQGAKPGEGGQLPGTKVSVRFAAQRGSIPGVSLISPPPHHDIYSIEDLQQLIHDIKSVNPKAKVSVKLVSSEGIGTIAAGVAKAGADVINVAGNSGGTGAALLSSIKHAGMPAELGLAEVDKALRSAGLRDHVQLRTSSGFKTAEDVIKAAILGADLYEFGTTAMLAVGCKMQRTCNKSCEPGVATDGEKFKGEQIAVERFFLNIAACVQTRLQELGFSHLREIRGHTELLSLVDKTVPFDFSAILDRTVAEPVNPKPAQTVSLARKEDVYVQTIQQVFDAGNTAFASEAIALTEQDRSFGARIAGHFVGLEKRSITLNTMGIAGQSYGFVNPKGTALKHTGIVQDGCGKSMTGGVIAITAPDALEENTIAGNATFFGASGGEGYINGRVGHRFGVLLKGASVVVEGAGDYACEYMTSGTAMILGPVGQGLGAGASAGIIFAYGEPALSDSVRRATPSEAKAYEKAIHIMLTKHYSQTHSAKAKYIVEHFEQEISRFGVVIPKELDNIKTLTDVNKIIASYQLREADICPGMQVWLMATAEQVLAEGKATPESFERLSTLLDPSRKAVFEAEQVSALLAYRGRYVKGSEPVTDIEDIAKPSTRTTKPVAKRLATVYGIRDDTLKAILGHIDDYAQVLVDEAGECSTCWAQSCSGVSVQTGCPDEKPINSINAKLQGLGPLVPNAALSAKQWKILREAFELQVKQTPFIAYTGAACPAPCQDACTETIPQQGEAVPIKSIEYNLYQLGRFMGWFEAPAKTWTPEESKLVFGGDMLRKSYDKAMHAFVPAFAKPQTQQDKEVVIIGSGPAAMQVAYEALRDGLKVRMYERSDRPGGLLADGIPAHKFDKTYIAEDFARLQRMGLELHLNSEVTYDKASQTFSANGHTIATGNNEKQRVVLCLGAGKPKTLPTGVVGEGTQSHIIQAVDFLKAANDIAVSMQENPQQDVNVLIAKHLGGMDPRGKKLVVIGGGDTAQDAIRWAARYLNQQPGGLTVLVRGPEQNTERGIEDSYPKPVVTPTKENGLRDEEIAYIGAKAEYLATPTHIVKDGNGVKVTVEHAILKHYEVIQHDAGIKKAYDSLPRSEKPTEPTGSSTVEADFVICALGFEGAKHLPLLRDTQGLTNVDIAGDAAGSQPWIIVGAQKSASDTYRGRIQPELVGQSPAQHSVRQVISL